MSEIKLRRQSSQEDSLLPPSWPAGNHLWHHQARCRWHLLHLQEVVPFTSQGSRTRTISYNYPCSACCLAGPDEATYLVILTETGSLVGKVSSRA